MAQDLVDVTISADDPEWLAGFVRTLVERRLAACGNIIPAIRSVYEWEGEVRDDQQALVILHTTADKVQAIIDLADAEHPDDVPQVLAVPVQKSHPAYGDWVRTQTG